MQNRILSISSEIKPLAPQKTSASYPRILRRRRVVTRPIIRIEPMLRFRINMNLRRLPRASIARASAPPSPPEFPDLSAIEPNHRAFSSLTRSIDSSAASHSSVRPAPVPRAPALSCDVCAAYNQTVRPPQQNPVAASRNVSPPSCAAHSTVASRSDITWESGTCETTFAYISGTSFSPKHRPRGHTGREPPPDTHP